jgi:AcrR family transcriptional regulator
VSAAGPSRPPRADAQANRERILTAAAQAFRDDGLDAGVAGIAQRAGVGSGTIFRNFPTKDDLIHAVVTRRVDQWIAKIDDELATGDPGARFGAFFVAAVAWFSDDRGILEAHERGILDQPALEGRRQEVLERTEQLLAQARRAGVLRPDIGAEDFYALAIGTAEAIEVIEQKGGPAGEGARTRHPAVVVAGLRPQ